MIFDYLVVGAGFAGAVLAERLASQMDKKVLVVDRRNHIGGNCYDYYDDHGILVHKYGPHIFYTSSNEVWSYLSQFTEWHPYQHRVLALVDGQKIPVPFNLNSLYQVFPQQQAARIEERLVASFGRGKKIHIVDFLQVEDELLQELASFVYEKIYYNYSRKLWGVDPQQLDPRVMGRVPFCIDRDNRYHADTYQGMPLQGYHRLFEKMLSHPNISLLLEKDYKEILGETHFKKMVYTGPLDYFFDYQFGPLPYKSLRWEWQTQQKEFYQEVAVVNYPNDYDYLRITEFKHLHGYTGSETTISLEYPCHYEPGVNDPIYPLLIDESLARHRQYQEVTEKFKAVYFLGRLPQYDHANMSQVIMKALATFAEIARD